MSWKPIETAPNNKTVVIMYRDAYGSHKAFAKRPKGGTSWHHPSTGVEITAGRFAESWMTKQNAENLGMVI